MRSVSTRRMSSRASSSASVTAAAVNPLPAPTPRHHATPSHPPPASATILPAVRVNSSPTNLFRTQCGLKRCQFTHFLHPRIYHNPPSSHGNHHHHYTRHYISWLSSYSFQLQTARTAQNHHVGGRRYNWAYTILLLQKELAAK